MNNLDHNDQVTGKLKEGQFFEIKKNYLPVLIKKVKLIFMKVKRLLREFPIYERQILPFPEWNATENP